MKSFKKHGYIFDLLNDKADRAFQNAEHALEEEDDEATIIESVWGVACGDKVVDSSGTEIPHDLLTRCAKFPVTVYSDMGEKCMQPFVKIYKDVMVKRDAFKVKFSNGEQYDSDDADIAVSFTIGKVGPGWTRWGEDSCGSTITSDSHHWAERLRSAHKILIYNLKDMRNPKCVGEITKEPPKKVETYETVTNLTSPRIMSDSLVRRFEPFIGCRIKVTIEDVSPDC